MSVQDGKDIGGGELFGGQRVCAYRYGEILCGKGHQQANDAREGTHGMSPWNGNQDDQGWEAQHADLASTGPERDRSVEKSVNGPSEHPDAGGLLRDHEQLYAPSQPETREHIN